ncbi:glycosyltransferase [Brucella tritici]|uniref:Glycosyltransferase n=1 Tax=Brucella tritici TaxID=94626 RepID=A0A7V7VQG2_9HYPH|nr:glycosyltransferase [Brucella tritici]KAB2654940.1 glycosyltransferase [Brucella tritici]
MTKIQPDKHQSTIIPSLLLTISIVTFKPDPSELRSTLDSLAGALSGFDRAQIAITIVDNSPEDMISDLLQTALRSWDYKLIQGHGNVGFGRAHNLAIETTGQYHLVLNPDVQMAPDALKAAVEFMQEHPACGLISPYAVWPNGERQYLCKQKPSVLDLFLRGFAPVSISQLFEARLRRYEMQIETQDAVFWNPPIVSGCFMFLRGDILKKIQGFDHRYFLYFEDFDLSLRCACRSSIAFVPYVRIVHAGGHASRKGLWHRMQFIKSALLFYRTHGMRLA